VVGAVARAGVKAYSRFQEALERERQARIDDEVAIRLGVEAALKASKASRTPPKERGKLSDAAWAEHLDMHPLKRDEDGKLLRGAPWRQKKLKIEQGIDVVVSTVTRRINRPAS
jgi:hypothetical protein